MAWQPVTIDQRIVVATIIMLLDVIEGSWAVPGPKNNESRPHRTHRMLMVGARLISQADGAVASCRVYWAGHDAKCSHQKLMYGGSTRSVLTEFYSSSSRKNIPGTRHDEFLWCLLITFPVAMAHNQKATNMSEVDTGIAEYTIGIECVTVPRPIDRDETRVLAETNIFISRLVRIKGGKSLVSRLIDDFTRAFLQLVPF